MFGKSEGNIVNRFLNSTCTLLFFKYNLLDVKCLINPLL